MDIPGGLDPITAGLNLGNTLISRIFPNKEDADKAKLALMELQQNGQLAELTASTQITLAGANIVNTEAASKSWLAVNWRPISMLVFLALIVARMFGFTTANVTPAEYEHLWSIIQLGFGGYVIGRSVEKVVPAVAGVIANAKAGS